MLGSNKSKLALILILIGLTFFSSGCLNLLGAQRSQKPQEKKLNEFQGLGVLEFNLKTGYSADRVTPGAQVFTVLSIRNHALGDKARNVIASIQNVDNIIDCQGNLWPAHVKRSSCLDNTTFEPDGCGDYEKGGCKGTKGCKWVPKCVGNNFYTLNPNLSVNQQGIKKIRPNEEVQFLYLTEIPSREDLRGISQERDIHYTIEYDYSKHMSYLVRAMSSTEFVSRKRQQEEGVQVSHDFSSTPGALQVKPRLPEPITYNLEGKSPTYNLVLEFKNKGGGLPVEGQNATFIMYFNSSILKAVEHKGYGWNSLSEGDDGYARYGVNLTSSDLILGKTKRFRFEITDNYLEVLQRNKVPLTSFKFDFDMNYSYMRQGKRTLQVIPIES